MKWTEERKKYLRKLFPCHRLGFLLLDSSMKVSLKAHDMSEYDYIITSSDLFKYYVIFDAMLHIGQQSICLKKARLYSRKDEVLVVSKELKQNGLYEKCLVVPYGQEDKLSKELSYYFNEVKPINDKDNREYAYFDKESKSIKAMNRKE